MEKPTTAVVTTTTAAAMEEQYSTRKRKEPVSSDEGGEHEGEFSMVTIEAAHKKKERTIFWSDLKEVLGFNGFTDGKVSGEAAKWLVEQLDCELRNAVDTNTPSSSGDEGEESSSTSGNDDYSHYLSILCLFGL